MRRMRGRWSSTTSNRVRPDRRGGSRWMIAFGSIDLRGDGRWLAVLAALTLIELIWWALCWSAGIAPAPHVGTYLALAIASLVAALALRLAFRPRAQRPPWSVLLL